MARINEWLLGTLAVALVGVLFFSWNLDKKVTTLMHETHSFYKEFGAAEEVGLASSEGDPFFCGALKGVPFAEDEGIIKSIKHVRVDGVTPLNGSIVEDKDGYLMVFRYDVKERKTFLGIKTPFRQKIPFTSQKMPFRTFIGAVRLDKEFKQVSPVKTIDTGSDFSEDPRVFRAEGMLYISYNDMQDHEIPIRGMRLARIDPDSLETKFVTDVDQQISFIDRTSHVEKNWTPFVRKEVDGEEKIYFGYSINPHKIMKMKSPQSCEMDHPIYPPSVAFQKMPWNEKKWGTLRGGTPARLVDGQYLAFFHTLFYEGKRPWYVMGAYTFEADPPYRITAVSATPILFKNIYRTPATNTAYSNKRAFFPAGFVLGREEGRDVIYLSAGENDSSLKIVTFDKQALLESLAPVPFYKVP